MSDCAPGVASASDARVKQMLATRLEYDGSFTAVRVRERFFDHLEVWPDIVLSEFRVAIEYDTTGRDGLEHVGKREAVDRRKDRVLRSSGWEVIRVRTGKLHPIGPWDVPASGPTVSLVDLLIERLRELRGDLLVDCYLRR